MNVLKYPANVWDNNPTEWPSVQYHDVYHHLIKSPRVFSTEAMENYKYLEAYKFFVSEWVQTIKHMVIPTGSEVTPAHKTSNHLHHPWVAINKRGSIVIGHCNCMAG